MIRWLIALLMSGSVALSVIGGIRVDFTPTYMIIAMPSECKQGGVFQYKAPTQQYYTSLMEEVTRWLKSGR